MLLARKQKPFLSVIIKLMTINKKLIDSIVSKTVDKVSQQYNLSPIIRFEELYALLSDLEIDYVKELLKEKEIDYGIAEPFLGLEEAPHDAVAIIDQTALMNGKPVFISTQYLPRVVYEAYDKLRNEYESESGRKLLVGSGYRSHANQAGNFMYWLKYYDYDFRKTIRFVSIPGYSEHSSTTNTAIDFRTQENVGVFDAPPFGRFDEYPEYIWLIEHASEYGFILSCPKDNDKNQQYEPWHWQYRG